MKYVGSEQQQRQHFTASIETKIRYSFGGFDRQPFDLFKNIYVMKDKRAFLKLKIGSLNFVDRVSTLLLTGLLFPNFQGETKTKISSCRTLAVPYL